ncbi:transcriptional regulator with XRE-family HTH domain [Agrobacterium vitis]|nr:transcriptional regulator with XRE-family HTH domain [Agrobacterium vitis]MBE1438312.1 transcriptional regulator with XRE-family HTH domain [Agrobacterium vitis]
MSDNQTIGGRLRLLRKKLGLSQQELADRLELSVRGWQKIERNEAVPSGDTLLRCEAIGYNPGWILTGFGPELMDDAKLEQSTGLSAIKNNTIDAELMERLHDRVASIFHDVGQKPPQRRIAREAANLYNELAKVVQDMSDAEMVDAALPMVALDFKRKLERAAAEPGTGKRSAS